MKDLYSVKDVAQLFGLQEARIRYWAQTGFVGPSVRQGGRAFYTFQDLVGVKVAKELLDGGLSLQRVRKNLDALRGALPRDERPLSSLRICSDGDKVLVVDDQVAYEPQSGQLVLSFTLDTLESEIAKILELPRPAKARARAGPESSYQSFLRALEAEDTEAYEEAEALYREAVTSDPRFAAAWTNLGNVLEIRGRKAEAREAYERALSLDPEQPEARYNLANLLADLGETELALAEYRRVVGSCPDFADAHYNLGLLYSKSGDAASARAHLQRYVALDPDSDWAERARLLLDSLG